MFTGLYSLKLFVISYSMENIFHIQSVSCEIKFAHAHVRARPHVCDVRAKRLSKRACDVRACGRNLCVRRAIAISHVLG